MTASVVSIDKQDGEDKAKKSQNEPGVKSLDEAVSLTGYGLYHILLLVVAGFGSMGAVMEMYVVGFIIPAIQCEFDLTDGEKGQLGAVTFIGILLSGAFWGGFADRKGRKYTMMLTLFCDSVLGIMSSLAPNYTVLICLRFLSGCFISAPATLGYTYVGEFNTPKNRNRSISIVGVFTACVSIVLAGMGRATLLRPWQVETPLGVLRSWRLMPIIAVIPGLICAISLSFLPESPKYLVAVGKPDAALMALRRVYARNLRKKPETFPIMAIKDEGTAYKAAEKSFKAALLVAWHQIAPLFKPPLLFHTILMCFIQFGNLASGCGLLFWTPELFNLQAKYTEYNPDSSNSFCDAAQGLRVTFVNVTDKAEPICDDSVKDLVFINSLIVGSVNLIFAVAAGFLVNIIGKKNLLVGSQTIAGVACIALNFATTYTTSLVLTCIMFPMTTVGISLVANVAVDLFPTHLRAMAVSLTFASGESGSSAGNLIFGYLLQSHCSITFYIFGGALLLNGALSCLIPKRGKYAS